MNQFRRPKSDQGWIEIIVGCMYSGKTEELIRQIRRAEIARQPHQLFKPRIDNRYSKTEVASHNQTMQPSQVIGSAKEIFDFLNNETEVVGIDEGQFFSKDLVEVANEIADSGRRVIVAGLDTDWKGRPFGPIPELLAIAEVVHKQHAICVVCGAPATRTQRIVRVTGGDILVGSDGLYEARCRKHFYPRLISDRRLTKPANNGKTEVTQFSEL